MSPYTFKVRLPVQYDILLLMHGRLSSEGLLKGLKHQLEVEYPKLSNHGNLSVQLSNVYIAPTYACND